MTAIAEKLDRKLSDWKPETASEVEKLVAEIIDWADADALDLMRPRHLEQEVLFVLRGTPAKPMSVGPQI